MGRVLAISDIHGCYKTFIALLEDVVQLKKEDVLYLLGDYVDRGPSSKDVIDYIFKLRETGFKVITLKGNHEQMFLDSISDTSKAPRFLNNGGDKTIASFGISHPNQLNVKYLTFLKSLEYYATYKNFILVHAGLNFDIMDPMQDLEAMLWLRRFKPTPEFDKIIIHGHTPTAMLEIQDSIINARKEKNICIDNGCVYGLNEFYGNLCCLDLDSLKLYTQSNVDSKPLF